MDIITTEIIMKKMIYSFIIALSLVGCTPDVEFTHQINPKHLPISFIEEGEAIQLNEGYFVEVFGELEDNWRVRLNHDGIVKSGLLPKHTESGNHVLIYTERFDRKVAEGEGYCNRVKIEGNKVITLRTRPLTYEETTTMVKNRNGITSRTLNKETAIIGLGAGVKFLKLEGGNDKWQKVRVKSKFMELEGYFSKKINGVSSVESNCK